MNQGCALAEPSGPWRLTFALGRLENLIFFSYKPYALHPRFYSFGALGSLQFSLEHSLDEQIKVSQGIMTGKLQWVIHSR